MQTTREFNVVYRKATKVWHTPYFVLFFKKDDTYKVGLVASKKVGNAVHRNRAKRLMKAHFIENIDQLSQGSYVLVAKLDLLNQSFLETQKSYLHALKKCTALVSLT
ncbi:MAG: ribonuclease P protein component [Sulfurovum sp.]|nr:ribonuclease P protein component [Sulfurovum sp.]